MRLFEKPECYIYEASGSDYSDLAAIHLKGFSRGWSADDIAVTHAGKGVNCLVVNIRGQGKSGPKGFLMLRTLVGQSEILTIAIKPEYRGIGLARALMDHAIRDLQKEQVEQFFLEVSEDNLAALNLYRSLKFEKVSERKAYYNAGIKQADGEAAPSLSAAPNKSRKVNALVMQLELR